MDVWPITIKGEICPAHGSLTQWEIGHGSRRSVAQLPLNPYGVTTGTPVLRKVGLPITCTYNSHSVTGQFHRYSDNKGICIYTNRSVDGPSATDKWYSFLSLFGIEKGKSHENIPVYLDFYSDLVVVIRLGN